MISTMGNNSQNRILIKGLVLKSGICWLKEPSQMQIFKISLLCQMCTVNFKEAIIVFDASQTFFVSKIYPREHRTRVCVLRGISQFLFLLVKSLKKLY